VDSFCEALAVRQVRGPFGASSFKLKVGYSVVVDQEFHHQHKLGFAGQHKLSLADQQKLCFAVQQKLGLADQQKLCFAVQQKSSLADQQKPNFVDQLKFEKDHLCSACQLGKSKKHTHKPKAENTNLEVLNTLHMDLCGPMRMQTINGKKYILVIVDDYSRFTWVKFLRSKDETSDVVIKFITQIQVGLNKTVRYVRTDNETEFVNQTMTAFYDQAVATACYTQNRSLIHTHHHKTSYELVHNKKPDLTFFRVFGALCYPINNSEDLRKLQPTADTGIFVGYAPSRKCLPPSIVVEPHFTDNHNVAPVDNNPFVNVFASEPHSEASSSGDISSTESPYISQTLHHLNKWIKDHPLDNVIGNPSRPVSTRKQLTTDALCCLYNSVLSKIEPKNFKSVIIEDYWFQAMQDEIHEFDRLQVWELVPQPDCVMIIALK
nr:Gag-Pol polyprotein [Tanacetum cinerariifolium]